MTFANWVGSWNAILAPALGLAGVVAGVLLTGHWQRNQWIRDNKKGEYREVLDLLNKLHQRLLYWQGPIFTGHAGEMHWTRQAWLKEACTSLASVLDDRIFIRHPLKEKGVGNQFEDFIRALEGGKFDEPKDAAGALSQLHETVLDVAEGDLGLGKG